MSILIYHGSCCFSVWIKSHAGKVVLRSWYEKNKHIFPASRWEPYDPEKKWDKYTVGKTASGTFSSRWRHRLLPVTTCLCIITQSRVLIDMDKPVWCEITWLTCPKSWPHSDRTLVGTVSAWPKAEFTNRGPQGTCTFCMFAFFNAPDSGKYSSGKAW